MEWEKYCLNKEVELQKMFPDKNIKNPKTLTEKIQWLKIHDSTFLKTFCADKITLHDYCKNKLGKDICIPILKIYDNVNKIDLNELPDKFVLKCNHGSGYNIIVKNKKELKLESAKEKLQKWLNINYGDLACELHYNNIPKKIFAEKYMIPENENSLLDYKFWCFNGEPKFFTINSDLGHGNFNHYDLNGKLLDISRTDFPADPSRNYKMPKSLNKMIEYSRLLSKDFSLVRVDFYEINNEPVLGELTFTPGSGRMKFKNPNTDLELGNLLKI